MAVSTMQQDINSGNEQLKQYLDIAPTIFVVLGDDMKIKSVNKTACTKLGYSETELIGLNWFDNVVHKNERIDLKTAFLEIINGIKPLAENYTNSLQTKDGSVITINWYNSAIYDTVNPQKVISTISYGIDVTDKINTETQLSLSEERYQLAVQGIAAGVWDLFDTKSILTVLSPKVFDLLGKHYEDRVFSEPEIRAWLYPEDLETVVTAFYNHVKYQAPFNVEARLKNDKLGYRWFLISGKAKFNSSNYAERIVGSIIDIHDRKLAEDKLKEREALFVAVFNSNVARSILLDYEGYIVELDKDTQNFGNTILGIDLVGIHYTKGAFGINDFTIPNQKIDEARSGKISEYEYNYIQPDGKTAWYRVQYTPIYKNEGDNRPSYILCSHLEITNSKEAQAEILKAKELAEESNRLKSNFLKNMSHEIRTPLNGIIGIANLLEQEEEIEKVKELATLQKQSSNRLLNTLTTILNYSKLEAEFESLPVKKVDITETLTEAADSLKSLAKSKRLNFVYKKMPAKIYCYGDEGFFFQVFHNLIHNAIKFTQQGEIVIELRKTGNTAGSLIVLSVSDTGIGIAPEYLDKIFTPFQQESEGESRNYEGSGLGLSIAKRYLELLGGMLKVESEKGKGSTFYVYLPLAS